MDGIIEIFYKRRGVNILLCLEIFLGGADLRRGPMGWGGGIFYENFYHKILLRGGAVWGEGFGEGILAPIGVIL